jgi:hypothetical protein
MVAGVGRVQELARSEGRPALGKRQRTKPRSRYQTMCMADVLSFAEVLTKVQVTSVSGVRTAQCVAELLLNAQGDLRGMASR